MFTLRKHEIGINRFRPGHGGREIAPNHYQ